MSIERRTLVFVAYSPGFDCYAMFRRRLARLLSRLHGPRLAYSSDPRGFVARCAGEAEWVTGATKVAEEDLGGAGLTHAVIFDDGESCVRLAGRVESMGLPVRRVPVQVARVVNVDRGQECDVYIGRGSEWGNPYALGFDGDREEVLRKFRYDFERGLLGAPDFMTRLKSLRGKRLGCHCKPAPCHGDILAEYLNGLDEDE
jgi:hypothetical protein